MKKLVLGIETSCDDTSVCLLEGEEGVHSKEKAILYHQRFSQDLILRKWGGVVPEIASRNHLEKLSPLVEEAFSATQKNPGEVDLIAVTTHPGLLGPLLTGLNHAKFLSLYFERPIIPVNHLYAHLEAIHLTENIDYPYLGMLISGGHSAYFKVSSPTTFELIGTTTDDAAGEAFDKGGKILGLPYPAGKYIDEYARSGSSARFSFPIGLKHSKNAQLSFSGLKTSLRAWCEENPSEYESILKEEPSAKQTLNDLCASYQKAIVDALILKLNFARIMAGADLPIVVGGGVACNNFLRVEMKRQFEKCYFVAPSFCTDNGAMIAHYGLRANTEMVRYPDSLKIDARGKFISKGP